MVGPNWTFTDWTRKCDSKDMPRRCGDGLHILFAKKERLQIHNAILSFFRSLFKWEKIWPKKKWNQVNESHVSTCLLCTYSNAHCCLQPPFVAASTLSKRNIYNLLFVSCRRFVFYWVMSYRIVLPVAEEWHWHKPQGLHRATNDETSSLHVHSSNGFQKTLKIIPLGKKESRPQSPVTAVRVALAYYTTQLPLELPTES